MSSNSFSDERRRLYHRVLHEYRAQYINYEKYYLASDCLSSKGKLFDLITTLFAAVLLILISGLTRGLEAAVVDIVVLFFSASTAALSFATTIGSWKPLATEYFKAGQIHNNLYSDFDEMVKERLPDPEESDEKLKEDCDILLQRKDELNRATPQLDSKWYFRLLERENGVEWDRKSLEELQQGDSEFYNPPDKPDWYKFKRFVIWVLL